MVSDLKLCQKLIKVPHLSAICHKSWIVWQFNDRSPLFMYNVLYDSMLYQIVTSGWTILMALYCIKLQEWGRISTNLSHMNFLPWSELCSHQCFFMHWTAGQGLNKPIEAWTLACQTDRVSNTRVYISIHIILQVNGILSEGIEIVCDHWRNYIYHLVSSVMDRFATRNHLNQVKLRRKCFINLLLSVQEWQWIIPVAMIDHVQIEWFVL